MSLNPVEMECLRCGERVKPWTSHVQKDNTMVWLYKCVCGSRWPIYQKPEVEISEIGSKDTLIR